MEKLLAEIPFGPLANALMAGLGARAHEWKAWLLIEDLEGDVELLVLAREPFETEDNQLSQHWYQRKVAGEESPSRVLIEMLERAHLGQNGALSSQIPGWKDLPSAADKRAFAQGAPGAQAFAAGTAVKVRSSKGYIAFEQIESAEASAEVSE